MNNQCIFCWREKFQGAGIFYTLFPHPYLCATCLKQLQKNKKSVSIYNHQVTALFVYDDFFETLIFQYKDCQDTLLKNILLPPLAKILKKYKNIPIVFPPSSQRKSFIPLKYLLSDYTIIDCFHKTKNYKQSLQKESNRHHIQKIIQLSQTPLPKKVILIDDVITSGNTLKRCIELLHSKHIEVIPIVLSVHKDYFK